MDFVLELSTHKISMNLEFKLEMLFVSFSISRDKVKVIIGINEDLNLLVGRRADTTVLLSTTGQEAESAEVDIKC